MLDPKRFIILGSLAYLVGRWLHRAASRRRAVRQPPGTNDRRLTDEVAAEDRLRRTEQRYRLLSQNATEYGILFLNPAGRVTHWSSGAERIFGWHAAETAGQPADIIFTIEDRAGGVPQQEMDQALGHGRTIDERWHQRKDGSRFFASGVLTALRDESGRHVGFAKIVRDITDRKQAEEDLRQSRHQLQEANQTLERRVAQRTAEAERHADQLRRLAREITHAEQRERRRVAQVLHDHLQQLLVGGKLQMSLLRRQVMRDPQATEICRQLDDLLDQSLEATRSLTAELSPSVLYTGRFGEALQWLARWMLDKYGLTVQVEADPALDPRQEDLRAVLFAAARELLFNTVKHAKVSQAFVRFDQPTGNQVRLVVEDQGAGFEASRQPSGDSSGFGLLSISERLELIGGRMSIASRPGHGTTVTLVAPLQEESTPPATAAQGQAAAPEEKIRVLLADDHAVVRDGLTRLLEAQPDMHVVGQAWDGLHAVQMALQLRPDVIIMDINMPGISGTVATSRIREALPDVRIIGLSMFAGQEVADRMTAAGAVRYLGKSDPPDELLSAIRSVAAG